MLIFSNTQRDLKNKSHIDQLKDRLEKMYAFILSLTLEEDAEKLAKQLINSSSPAVSGVLSVKTESWSSKDGITHKSEKTESWGGS